MTFKSSTILVASAVLSFAFAPSAMAFTHHPATPEEMRQTDALNAQALANARGASGSQQVAAMAPASASTMAAVAPLKSLAAMPPALSTASVREQRRSDSRQRSENSDRRGRQALDGECCAVEQSENRRDLSRRAELRRGEEYLGLDADDRADYVAPGSQLLIASAVEDGRVEAGTIEVRRLNARPPWLQQTGIARRVDRRPSQN